MVTITPEIVIALIGLCGTVLGIPATIIGAWAWNSRTRVKAKADAEVADAQARLKAIEAKGEAEKAQAATLANLVIGYQQFGEHLKDLVSLRHADNQKAESNYRVFTDVSNENARTVMGHLDYHAGRLMTAIGAIPERVGAVNNDGIALLVGELGSVITKEFAVQRAERSMHPFPASEDSEWRDEFIRPVQDVARIYKQPSFDDEARLHKTCAHIKPEGEIVRVIQGRLKGWLIVDKVEAGQRCWGWIPDYQVLVGRPETNVPAPA